MNGDSITVKIISNLSIETKDGKKLALYEVEPFDYGDHNYSSIRIEYQSEEELKEFTEGKSVKIEAGRDMTKGEGKTLIISGGTWSADYTAWQKIKDTTKETTNKIGDASAKTVGKAGKGLSKAGKNLEERANQDKWPRWVLPVGIGLGILLLIGIIIWIFKPKKG